jgi:hypothetical protein
MAKPLEDAAAASARIAASMADLSAEFDTIAVAMAKLAEGLRRHAATPGTPFERVGPQVLDALVAAEECLAAANTAQLFSPFIEFAAQIEGN